MKFGLINYLDFSGRGFVFCNCVLHNFGFAEYLMNQPYTHSSILLQRIQFEISSGCVEVELDRYDRCYLGECVEGRFDLLNPGMKERMKEKKRYDGSMVRKQIVDVPMSSHKRVLECGMRRVNLEVPSRRARSVSSTTYACNFFFFCLVSSPNQQNNTELSREQVTYMLRRCGMMCRETGEAGFSSSMAPPAVVVVEKKENQSPSTAAAAVARRRLSMQARIGSSGGGRSFKWREEKRTSLVVCLPCRG